MDKAKKKTVIKIQRDKHFYYVIGPPIGKGAYGKVFIGLDEDGHHYAVKFFENSELNRKSLISELEMYYRLKCDNIISIKDVVCTNKNTYVFLELCDCETLESFFSFYKKNFGHLPTLRLTQIIFKQIASGLHYMAKNNCMHRDIKLENIMLSKSKTFNDSIQLNSVRLNDLNLENITNRGKSTKVDSAMVNFECKTPDYYSIKSESKLEEEIDKYTVKIIDLGFARKFGKGNVAGTVCGTPMWWAPEIWGMNEGENESYDEKVDVFSFGATLYYFVFGQFLFPAETKEDLIFKLKKGEYKIPLKTQVITLEFIDLLTGLIANSPSNRFGWDDICAHPFFTEPLSKQKVFEQDKQHKNECFLNLSNHSTKRWIEVSKCKNNEHQLLDTRTIPSKETEYKWEIIKLNLIGEKQGVETIRIRDANLYDFEVVEVNK